MMMLFEIAGILGQIFGRASLFTALYDTIGLKRNILCTGICLKAFFLVSLYLPFCSAFSAKVMQFGRKVKRFIAKAHPINEKVQRMVRKVLRFLVKAITVVQTLIVVVEKLRLILLRLFLDRAKP
ncbi:MAG: hypothetical protein LBE37_19925 [Sphingobacterium sp.]|jgi:hypothetical protein|nr:hypothetical protein [Sphingobacterium sp.]